MYNPRRGGGDDLVNCDMVVAVWGISRKIGCGFDVVTRTALVTMRGTMGSTVASIV